MTFDYFPLTEHARRAILHMQSVLKETDTQEHKLDLKVYSRAFQLQSFSLLLDNCSFERSIVLYRGRACFSGDNFCRKKNKKRKKNKIFSFVLY